MPSSREQGEPTNPICLAECSIVHGLSTNNIPQIQNQFYSNADLHVLRPPRISDKVNASQQQAGRVRRTIGDGRCQELIAAGPPMPSWKKRLENQSKDVNLNGRRRRARAGIIKVP